MVGFGQAWFSRKVMGGGEARWWCPTGRGWVICLGKFAVEVVRKMICPGISTHHLHPFLAGTFLGNREWTKPNLYAFPML